MALAMLLCNVSRDKIDLEQGLWGALADGFVSRAGEVGRARPRARSGEQPPCRCAETRSVVLEERGYRLALTPPPGGWRERDGGQVGANRTLLMLRCPAKTGLEARTRANRLQRRPAFFEAPLRSAPRDEEGGRLQNRAPGTRRPSPLPRSVITRCSKSGVGPRYPSEGSGMPVLRPSLL